MNVCPVVAHKANQPETLQGFWDFMTFIHTNYGPDNASDWLAIEETEDE
jgi:hypothetical protein